MISKEMYETGHLHMIFELLLRNFDISAQKLTIIYAVSWKPKNKWVLLSEAILKVLWFEPAAVHSKKKVAFKSSYNIFFYFLVIRRDSVSAGCTLL